jgi:hypothetical protein
VDVHTFSKGFLFLSIGRWIDTALDGFASISCSLSGRKSFNVLGQDDYWEKRGLSVACFLSSLLPSMWEPY